MDASCTDTHGYLSDGVSINSPDYPAHYPWTKSCTWNISVPIGFKINIEPFSYDIEPGFSGSCYDYLNIFDITIGDINTYSTPIAELCGRDTYPGHISTDRYLFFAFYSDVEGSKNVQGGFQFQLSMIGMKRA